MHDEIEDQEQMPKTIVRYTAKEWAAAKRAATRHVQKLGVDNTTYDLARDAFLSGWLAGKGIM